MGKATTTATTDNSSPEAAFNTLQSQLKTLINRVSRSSGAGTKSKSKPSKSKSKSSSSKQQQQISSPDEASLALGKQLASVYASLYFRPRCHSHCHLRDKLKTKWREEGFDLIRALLVDDRVGASDAAHGALRESSGAGAGGSTRNNNNNNNNNNISNIIIASFFESLAEEVDLQINDNGNWNENENENQIKNKNEQDRGQDLKTIGINNICDDLSYWWVGVISHCEQAGVDNNNNNSCSSTFSYIIVKASIRGYVKFAFLAYRYRYRYRYRHNHEGSGSDDDHDDHDDHEEDIMQLVRLYKKLERNTNRQYLIREIINTTFHHRGHDSKTIATAAATATTTTTTSDLNFMTPLLSEIINKTALSSNNTAAINENIYQYEEQNLALYLSILLREYTYVQSKQRCNYMNMKSDVNATEGDHCLSLLPWFIQSLEKLFMKSGGGGGGQMSSSSSSALLSISFDFCCQLCDTITTTIMTATSAISAPKHQRLIEKFLNTVLEKGFSILLNNEKEASSPSSLSLLYTVQPFLLQRLNTLTSFWNTKNVKMKVNVSSTALYNLAITTLVSFDESNIALQLELMSHLIRGRHTKSDGRNDVDEKSSCLYEYSPMMMGLFYAVGHIFLSTPAWSSNVHANDIIEVTTAHLHQNSTHNHTALYASNLGTGGNISVPLNYHDIYYREKLNDIELLKLLSSSKKGASHILTSSLFSSTTEQSEALLLCLSSLVVTTTSLSSEDDNCDDEILPPILALLDSLLQELPELGRRSLPVLKITFQHFITKRLANKVQKLLEFMCTSVAQDASCAHEVWSMLSTMIDSSSSASIRVQCMVLRLYPLLCDANKRLYGRIIESLGKFVSHPNLELKVTAAASICELAERDLIRDVSDVIGWIQSFLTDEENMIVYYAILSLHHLVCTNELDYAIVLGVLNNKLVNFSKDVTGILDLDDIVIEALVQFLGNGETDDDDDSSSESDEDEQYMEKSIPLHTRISITTLSRLALSEPLVSMISGGESLDVSKLTILNAIYNSLSCYSIESFQIDEDLICREEYDENNQYHQLKQIVNGGTRLCKSCPFFSESRDFKSTITKLSSRLEQIELLSPVSARWIQQNQKRR